MPRENLDNDALQIFVASYNDLHGSSFVVESAVHEPQEDPSVDLVFRQTSGPPLKVQWTRGGMPSEERRALRPRLELSSHISARLAKAGLRGYSLLLSLGELPADRADSVAIAELAAGLICRSARRDRGPVVIEEDELSAISQRLGAAIEALVIAPTREDIMSARAIFSVQKQGLVIPSPLARASAALERKSSRLGPSAADLVLVIELETQGFEPDEVAELLTSPHGDLSSFSEVWVLHRDLESGKRVCSRWSSIAV